MDSFGGIRLGPIAPIAGGAVAESYGPSAVFVVAGVLASVVVLTGLVLPAVRSLD